MNKNILIVLILVILGGVGIWFMVQKPEVVVTNFEECVAAGNPVMESYPAQCVHEGTTYVQELSVEEQQRLDQDAMENELPEDNMPIEPLSTVPETVKAYVVSQEGVDEESVTVVSSTEEEWSDSCLGLGGPAESCLFAITPGHQVTVEVDGVEQVYRTNEDGTVIRRES